MVCPSRGLRWCSAVDNFTLDELLAYIQADEEAALDGFHTSREWADRFNIPQRRMLEILKAMKGEGKLIVSQALRERLDGQVQSVPVYSFDVDKVHG